MSQPRALASWRRFLVARAPGRGRCLEIGCGPGDFLRLLSAGDDARVVGLDLRADMTRRCRTALPRTPAVCADGCALPFLSASFDTVFVVDALALQPFLVRRGIVEEGARVLVTGGRLVLAVRNGRFFLNRRRGRHRVDAKGRAPAADDVALIDEWTSQAGLERQGRHGMAPRAERFSLWRCLPRVGLGLLARLWWSWAPVLVLTYRKGGCRKGP